MGYFDPETPSYSPPEPQPSRVNRAIDRIKDTAATVRDKLRFNKDSTYTSSTIPERFAWETHDDFQLRTKEYAAETERQRHQAEKVRRRKKIGGGLLGATLIVSLAVPVSRSLSSEEEASTGQESEQPIEAPNGSAQPESSAPSDTELNDEVITVSLETQLENTEPFEVILQGSDNAGLRENRIEADEQINGQDSGRRCEMTNVALPVSPTWEGVEAGAKTEFVVEPDEYIALKSELEGAPSITDAQAIYKRVLNAYRINVRYEDDNIQNISVNDYVSYLVESIRTLTFVPADLLQIPTTHELVIKTSDITGTEIVAAGTYGYGEVQLTAKNMGYASIHEWGHALQDYVCNLGIDYDNEFREVYTTVMAEIGTNPRYLELNMRYEASIHGGEPMTPEDAKEYRLMFELVGVSSQYSGRNYKEMFAVVFDSLVRYGYVGEKTVDGQLVNENIAQLVQEAVIERMQGAMPDVDVSAWLQYVTYYYQTGLTPDVAPPDVLVSMKQSPLDSHLQLGGEQGDAYPAVVVKAADHTEVIYAVHTEGKLAVYIRESGDPDLDASLRDAAQKYLLEFIGESASNGNHIITTTYTTSDTVHILELAV